MPRRTGSNSLKKRTLYISRENCERILMWSMSEKEIMFMCLGSGNSVKKVLRLCNISTRPGNYCYASKRHYKLLIKTHKKPAENVLAWGHSHPGKYHHKHPSQTDIDYAKSGEICLIAFPHSNVVRGWIMKTTVAKTKQNEVNIVISK